MHSQALVYYSTGTIFILTVKEVCEVSLTTDEVVFDRCEVSLTMDESRFFRCEVVRRWTNDDGRLSRFLIDVKLVWRMN